MSSAVFQRPPPPSQEHCGRYVLFVTAELQRSRLRAYLRLLRTNVLKHCGTADGELLRRFVSKHVLRHRGTADSELPQRFVFKPDQIAPLLRSPDADK